MRFFVTTTLLLLGLISVGQEKFTVLPPLQYQQKLTEFDDPAIIDVRTSFEHKQGHIPKATNINFLWFNFSEDADKLNRDRPVFIYCQTAHRSPFAAKKLHKMGFTTIYDLEGGFKAWEDSNLPVER